MAAWLKVSVPKADNKIVLRPRIYRRLPRFASPLRPLATAKSPFESVETEAWPETAGLLKGLGRRGRRYAEEHHGWDTVLDRLFAVYRGVLGR